jgi:hypothetical protein
MNSASVYKPIWEGASREKENEDGSLGGTCYTHSAGEGRVRRMVRVVIPPQRCRQLVKATQAGFNLTKKDTGGGGGGVTGEERFFEIFRRDSVTRNSSLRS